jgi:ribose-phosphate pyrophosphokinase
LRRFRVVESSFGYSAGGMNTEHPLIFCTGEYTYLRDALLTRGGEAGHIERVDFPDGERLLQIKEDVDDRDTIVVGGTTNDAATLELFDLANGLVTYGARRLTLIIPYFGYSTMERAVRPREVVTAKTRAHLLSSIPPASYGNRVLLLDLHGEGIPHYFDGGITAFHMYAKQLVQEAARRIGGASFVMACTDAGRAKWVESLANELHTDVAFVFKRRTSGTDTEVTATSAPVKGRDVVIYDDMIRTGGSLIEAAKAYRDAGAQKLWAITTHGLFPGNALDRIRSSGLFEKIVCTNSHPRARALACDFLDVVDCAPVFAKQLWG